MSISNHFETALLDVVRGVNPTVSGTYLQLHVGDPSETGTANVAIEDGREAVSFNAASGNSITSSATVSWTNVAGAETLTHWSLWDASTAGNCLWYGALSGSATVAIGDTFQITSLTLTLD